MKKLARIVALGAITITLGLSAVTVNADCSKKQDDLLDSMIAEIEQKTEYAGLQKTIVDFKNNGCVDFLVEKTGNTALQTFCSESTTCQYDGSDGGQSDEPDTCDVVSCN